MSVTTYDPAPLLRHLALTLPDWRSVESDKAPAGFSSSDSGHHVTDWQIATELGVSRRAVQRWRHGARLSTYAADRYACVVGLHPVLLWSDWYE